MSAVMLPAIGSRISLRHRLASGEHTDIIGVLEATAPVLRIRTKSDGVAEVAPQAVIAVKEISYRPVRTSEIRALEHAAALAWPGVAQHWCDGWLLRFGHGVTSRANSAVPLDLSANLSALPRIIEWYRDRGLPPWLLLPERVLPVRTAGVKQTRVLVRDGLHDGLRDGMASDGLRDGLASGMAPGVHDGMTPGPTAQLTPVPDAHWLTVHDRKVPVEVLTAVTDGEVTFGSVPGAVARGAVTCAPDGTHWLGISSVRVDPARRRAGLARRVCEAMLEWGAGRGAQRAYVEVLDDNAAAVALYASMGFRLHHRHRYVEATTLLGSTI